MAKHSPESILQARLRELMQRQQLSHAALSRMAGLGQTAVNDIMSGRNQSPSNKAVEKLADVLGVGVEDLTSRLALSGKAQSSGKAQGSGDERTGKPGADAVPLIGIAEAGAWRMVSPLPADVQESVQPARSRNYKSFKHFALRVQGDSMNASRPPIGDGQIILCVDMADAGLEITDGRVYVVRRTRDGGQSYEMTVKRAFVFRDRIELRPESTNPAHKPIVVRRGKDEDFDGTRVEAIGLVYGTYASLE
ncbi:MAG: LexA family transcriptional regulator [Xanthobacteraceae bacterium]|nr:LexA family transcriptional regulator [Xanthobacteraceae bacterium]